eukprot:148352-Pyramimonas_sp.AAC.1
MEGGQGVVTRPGQDATGQHRHRQQASIRPPSHARDTGGEEQCGRQERGRCCGVGTDGVRYGQGRVCGGRASHASPRPTSPLTVSPRQSSSPCMYLPPRARFASIRALPLFSVAADGVAVLAGATVARATAVTVTCDR